MPRRHPYVPKHRRALPRQTWSRLRRPVLVTGVAVAATGIAVGSGALTPDRAPASTAGPLVLAGAIQPHAQRPVVMEPRTDEPSASRASDRAEGSDRVEEPSRAGRRAALDESRHDRRDHHRHARAGRDRHRASDEQARGKKGDRSRARHATRRDPRDIARSLMPRYGFASSEFGCLDALWVSESDWDVHADNPTSSAYGIPQALTSAWDLPADYRTNPVTQIKWGLGYIRDSYGTPCAAWSFKQANNYY